MTTIVLILLILSLLPSLKMLTTIYYNFSFLFLIILLMLLIICTRNIDIRIRLLIIAIMFIIYKKNFFIIFKALYKLYHISKIYPVSERENNNKIVKIPRQIFQPELEIVTNFKYIPKKPTIFICNYCYDRLENLMCPLLPVNMAVMMRTGLSFFKNILKWTIITRLNKNYHYIKKQVKNYIEKNISVFAYVTVVPKHYFPSIIKLHVGLLYIAKELDVPITLVSVSKINTYFGIITSQKIEYNVNETFKIDNMNTAIHKIKKYYKQMLR